MTIEFKYDYNIDKECWQRLINAGQMFGVDFPKAISITEENKKLAQERIDFFNSTYIKNKKNLKSGLEEIYQNPIPDFLPCYINTSGYSMDNFSQGYISVSVKKNNAKDFLTILAHEIGHFMFRKYYLDYCREINCSPDEVENIKEVLTILHNKTINNINDKGYKTHKKFRKIAMELWKKDNNLYKIIKNIKDI